MNTANPTPSHAAPVAHPVENHKATNLPMTTAAVVARNGHWSGGEWKTARWSALALLGLWFTMLPAVAANAPTTSQSLPRWIAQAAPAAKPAQPSMSVVLIPTPSRAYINERQSEATESRDDSEIARGLLVKPQAKVLRIKNATAATKAKPRIAQNNVNKGEALSPLPPKAIAQNNAQNNTRVADLPAADTVPPVLPEIINSSTAANTTDTSKLPQGLPAMRKIIEVSALKLPLSNALPEKYRDAAVSADNPNVPARGTRLAQDPEAPPVKPEEPVTNSDRLPNQIEVAVGTFVVLLTTTDLQTVAVADPNTADVAVVNARAVLVNGKTPGVTSLVIVDNAKIRQYQVRVTPASGTRPLDIAQQIGLPGVTVRQVQDSLILEGEVANADEAKRAAEVAAAYNPKIINQLVVREFMGADGTKAAQIQDTIALPNVRVRSVGETTFLDGTVETQAEYKRAQTVAEALSPKVVNLLALPVTTVEQARESITGSIEELQPLPGQTAAPLTVKQVGDQIILSGQVPDQSQIEQALASAGRTGLQVVNRLQVAPPPSPNDALSTAVTAAIGRPNIRVSGSVQRLVLEGRVPDSNAAVAAVQIARAFAREVDNLMQVDNPILVNVDISIVEINKNNARNLGIQLGSASLLTENIATTAPTVVPGTPGTATVPGTPATIIPGTTQRTTTIDPTARTGIFGFGEDVTGSFRSLDPLRARLDALYTSGKARLLSNPHTTVISGRTATFQVGGQVPVPSLSSATATGTTTGITFKDYGILLDVSTNANADGVVTMRVRAEVSAPDFTTGVTPPGGGSPIPGFTRRSTVTEVTTAPNGTLALSGLVSSDVTANITKIPILSKIPILGKLFQSKSFQRNESELVIFIRPTVISGSLAPGQTAFSGVVVSDNTTNVGTILGNPGIGTFNNGASISISGGGAAAAQ